MSSYVCRRLESSSPRRRRAGAIAVRGLHFAIVDEADKTTLAAAQSIVCAQRRRAWTPDDAISPKNRAQGWGEFAQVFAETIGETTRTTRRGGTVEKGRHMSGQEAPPLSVSLAFDCKSSKRPQQRGPDHKDH